MNQEDNQGAATVVDTAQGDADEIIKTDGPTSDPVVTALEPSEAVGTAARIDVFTTVSGAIEVGPTIIVNDALREEQHQDGLAIRAGASTPTDGQVTLRSDIRRLEQARALPEVIDPMGTPYFEPGSIERFADADGRTMAIVVSLGELCKQEVQDGQD